MHKIIYAIAWCFSLLPLQVLYLFADCGYVLIYHIARYRRKLAYKNIRESFPEKTKEECKRITKKFYRHFCNMFVETIKTLTMSDKEMAKRFVFENADIIDDYYEQNKSLILTLGHYGNWEWITFARIPNFKHPEYKCYSIYHKLENGAMNKFYYEMRSKSKSILIAQNQLLRALVSQEKKKEPAMYCFIADQGTMWEDMYIWVDFLNHETSPIIGPEKIAKRTGYDVIYLDVTVRKRGYYSLRFEKIEPTGKEYDVTRKYMQMMETTISRAPEYWLWTHKRWKRTRKTWEKVMHERNQDSRIELAKTEDKNRLRK